MPDALGDSSVTLAGTTGSATSVPEIMRVSQARFSAPGVIPVVFGVSDKQLGVSGTATGSAPALGTSSVTAAALAGSATGVLADPEIARVTYSRFTIPKAADSALTGTSTATLAGTTGSAVGSAVGSGAVVEQARVTQARFVTEPGQIFFAADPPFELTFSAIAITGSATTSIEAGVIGTTDASLAAVTGSADGTISSGDSSSLADLPGVSGTATGGLTVTGVAADSYVGVTGSATAVGIPVVAIIGTSAVTLDGPTPSSTGVASISGSSVVLTSGVFADINLASLRTLAGVTGSARGGLRALTQGRMRVPRTTRSNEQIRAK